MTMDVIRLCKAETKGTKLRNKAEFMPSNWKKVNVLHKWCARIYLRVQTCDDWGKIIDREVSILRVLYPFLHAAQIKGKAYKKFGIPTIMGEVMRPITMEIDSSFTKMFEQQEQKPNVCREQSFGFQKKKEAPNVNDSTQVKSIKNSMAIYDGVFSESDDENLENQSINALKGNLTETLLDPTKTGKHFREETAGKYKNGHASEKSFSTIKNTFADQFETTCYEHLICPRSCIRSTYKQPYEKNEFVVPSVDALTQETTTAESNSFSPNREDEVMRRDVHLRNKIKSSNLETTRAREKKDCIPIQILRSKSSESSKPTHPEALSVKEPKNQLITFPKATSNDDYRQQQRNRQETTCNNQKLVATSQFPKLAKRRLQNSARYTHSSSSDDEAVLCPAQKKFKQDLDNSSGSIFSKHSYSVTGYPVPIMKPEIYKSRIIHQTTRTGEGRERNIMHMDDMGPSHKSTRKRRLKSSNVTIITLDSSSSSEESVLPPARKKVKHNWDKPAYSIFSEHSYSLIGSSAAEMKIERHKPKDLQERTYTDEKFKENTLKAIPLAKLSSKSSHNTCNAFTSNSRNQNHSDTENVSSYYKANNWKPVKNVGKNVTCQNLGGIRNRKIPLKVYPSKPLSDGKYRFHNRDVEYKEPKLKSLQRETSADIHNTEGQPLKCTNEKRSVGRSDGGIAKSDLIKQKEPASTCKRICSQESPSSHTPVILSSTDIDSPDERNYKSAGLFKLRSQDASKKKIVGDIECIDLTGISSPSSSTGSIIARVQYKKFLGNSKEFEKHLILVKQEPSERCNDSSLHSNKLLVAGTTKTNDVQTKLLKNNAKPKRPTDAPQIQNTGKVGEMYPLQSNPTVNSHTERLDVLSQNSLRELTENVSHLGVVIDINAVLQCIEKSLNDSSESTIAMMNKFNSCSPLLLSNFCCEYDRAYSMKKLKPLSAIVK